ncbi:MAG TPA: hypothetical protein VLF66_03330 [Thermoanaerobaculia bacterium]|nr:hypothetical protein [Thermoanaerobaculia bacterium]
MQEAPRAVCVFLVPLVRDSDRQPHAPILWHLLQDALLRLVGGFTGPETVLYYRHRETTRGLWSPADGEIPVEDLSRKYVVAVPQERTDELRGLVRRIGNSFGQRVLYLEVAGYAELLEVRPEDGFLDV